jgi:hypothetical protein
MMPGTARTGQVGFDPGRHAVDPAVNVLQGHWVLQQAQQAGRPADGCSTLPRYPKTLIAAPWGPGPPQPTVLLLPLLTPPHPPTPPPHTHTSHFPQQAFPTKGS